MVAQKPGPQEAREARARQQMTSYSFRIHQHPAVGTYVEVTHKDDASRKHIVTPQGCSCEDWSQRCQPNGWSCKHQAMTTLWLSNGEMLESAPAPVETADARTARVLKDRELWD